MTDLVPTEVARLSPAEVRSQVEWVRSQMREALVDGVDYGQYPGWDRPALLKAGAETLLLAARLSSATTMVDDEDARTHQGVRYVCLIATHQGELVARREGYAGYDETRFSNLTGWRADWNNVMQMAQKRAVVAATKAALAASSLFAEGEEAAETRPPRGGRTGPPSRGRPRGDRPPDHVYDDLPEARRPRGAQEYRYDPADNEGEAK
jgi:hypothetical protein